MKKPSMYYWTTDSFNREWRLLVEGEYEAYEDGNNIIADLEVVEYWSEGDIFKEEDVLYEIVAFDNLLNRSECRCLLGHSI